MRNEGVIRFMKLLGYAASIFTILLWVILVWINPYFEGMNRSSPLITFSMLVIPAGVFVIGLRKQRSLVVFIAFLWSLPYSLYMFFSPSIFMLFGVTNLIYLLCFITFRMNKIKY